MCGRFVAASPRDVVVDVFGVDVDRAGDQLPLSYNVAPTDDVLTVVADDGRRALDVMSWGLGGGMINARAETLLDRPTFREPFLRRRCLLPVNGFYEWETLADGTKQPWFFGPVDTDVVAFAGIWSARSCAIVTSEAAEPVARLHDRMPVVVEPDDWEAWLDVDATPGDLHPLLVPPATAPLSARRVGRRVNDVRNDGPELLEEAPAPPEPLQLF